MSPLILKRPCLNDRVTYRMLGLLLINILPFCDIFLIKLKWISKHDLRSFSNLLQPQENQASDARPDELNLEFPSLLFTSRKVNELK